MSEFKTITADPPWPESGGGKCKRGADRYYPLMSLRDIERTIRICPMFRPAADAHLYIWVTNNYLPEGLELMRLLGFRYITNTVWIKMRPDFAMGGKNPIDIAMNAIQIGLGQYQRGAHELLLFGARGVPMVPEPEHRLPSVVFAPRGRHSEKPATFYNRIERVSPGPYLELFARAPRPDWLVWGNEITDNDNQKPKGEMI